MKHALFVLTLLFGASCSFFAEQEKASVAAAESAPQLPKGWSLHQDPAGFTVAVPAGWNVTRERQAGWIALNGAKGEKAVIWPAFVAQQQLDANAAGLLARQFARSLDPQIAWGAPESSPNRIRLAARGAQQKAVLLLTWANGARGAQVYAYSFSAPSSLYRASVDLFAGILDSFRIEKAAAKQASGSGADANPPAYVNWMEPNEHAFTLSIPEGWGIRGGAYRLTATDIRKGVNLFSPDGQIRIFFGDANIPAFTLPTRMYAQFGLREGSYTSIGDGSRLQIRNYVTGRQFAREYVETAVRGQCQSLSIDSSSDRPELTQGIETPQRAPGIARVETTGGDVTFSCTINGRSLKGYAAAVTRAYYSSIQGGLWYVENIFGVFAPPRQFQQARAACEKTAASFKLDPGWEARQKQIANEAVQQDYARSQQIQQRALRAIQEDMRATSDIIVNGYNRRQAVYDEISRKRENAILGTVDVVDPASGRQYKIENYSDYHWMDNQGNIAGTKTSDSPGLGWRQMIDLP